MRRVHANRPVLWREAQGKLLSCKRRDGRDKTLLVDTPTRVEGEEGKLMFCHDSSSLLFVFEKKQYDRINTREETMGQKEGGERAGHRLHNDRICGCND